MADDDDIQAVADAPEESGGGGGGFDLGILLGIPFAFIMIIVGLLLEGADPMSYIGISAACFVFGGTFGVTAASAGLKEFGRAPQLFLRAVRYTPANRAGAIAQLVGFAERARREGLLVLEDDLRSTEDEFMRRGVQLVVDGTDPELVKEILRTEVDSLHEELHQEASIFDLMGGYAPTMGIVGTVIGLVVTLSNISDPASLAGAIAIAFLATLYGVGSANLLWLPLAVKLKGCAADEVASKEMLIEGILAIQSGDNPRIVEEKLVAFLTRADRDRYRAAQDAGEDADMDLAA